MIHHHALSALQPALAYYFTPANKAAWIALFSDTASNSAHLDALYTELSAQAPDLRPYNCTRQKGKPGKIKAHSAQTNNEYCTVKNDLREFNY